MLGNNILDIKCLTHVKSLYGFTLVELTVVIALVAILSLLSVSGYSYVLNRSYTNATIQIMLSDAMFMDHWANHYGSFIDSSGGKKQWPNIPYKFYAQNNKTIYEIYLSPIKSPQYSHYHLIAKPTDNSGLKGSGCICIDDSHNILTGMSKDCNNSGQKC